jgi:hypothetical protein
MRQISSSRRRRTRIEATIALLLANKGKRVSLPEVQRVAGAQHGPRLKEIRARGYIIDNVMDRTADGEVHSWYILRAEPGEERLLFPLPEGYRDPEER